MQLPGYFTGSVPSIYPMDLYGYYTKISLVVLFLDVLNLCVLLGIVLLKKNAHKSYTYIPPPVQRGNRKQTYLLCYMLNILFTFCVTCRYFAIEPIFTFPVPVESNLNSSICDVSNQTYTTTPTQPQDRQFDLLYITRITKTQI